MAVLLALSAPSTAAAAGPSIQRLLCVHSVAKARSCFLTQALSRRALLSGFQGRGFCSFQSVGSREVNLQPLQISCLSIAQGPSQALHIGWQQVRCLQLDQGCQSAAKNPVELGKRKSAGRNSKSKAAAASQLLEAISQKEEGLLQVCNETESDLPELGSIKDEAEVPFVLDPNVVVVGVDPDVSGALAVLKGAGHAEVEVLDVPFVKVKVGATQRKRHDAQAIAALVAGIGAPRGSVAYIEQPRPIPMDGKHSWYGAGFGFGVWMGSLAAAGFTVVPVHAIVWKKAMNLAGKAMTKDDSRVLATLLFPAIAEKLKRKKDHGRAESILIAAFGCGMRPPVSAEVLETLGPLLEGSVPSNLDQME